MSELRTNLLKLGILGGGQLGRMLAQTALNYSFESINILDPNNTAPCHIFRNFQTGDLNDYETVYSFGKYMDIITIEIENINTKALKQLQNEGKKVYPQAEVIETIKNKATQKQFYLQNNIPTAQFYIVKSETEIVNYKDKLPLVQKTQVAGYDGKGVFIIKNEKDINNCLRAPSILEEKVDIEKELSIIVVRSANGQIQTYPIVEMFFNSESNLLEHLISPADISIQTQKDIKHLAEKLASLLKIVGVFAIELFLTKNGDILVNEIAPRVHNSGHHTKGAFSSSQFDSHIRAISTLPIDNIQNFYKYSGAINILGSKNSKGIPTYNGVYECLNYSGVDLTLYGKNISSPYRKLGHISIFDNDQDAFYSKMNNILKLIKIES